MNFLKWFLAEVLVFWMASCTHEPTIPQPDVANTSQSVCFQQDVLPLFQTYCSRTQGGCHDAGNPRVALVDYTGIIKGVSPHNLSGSWFYNAIGKGMPPYAEPQLTAAQQSTIARWINEGAQNNNCPDRKCDSLYSGFETSIAPVIATYCNGCHGNSQSSSGIIFDSYVHLKDFIKTDTARFMNSIRHQAGTVKNMPPFAPLPECAVFKIENWVKNGMPQ
jgi:hypothetical protein